MLGEIVAREKLVKALYITKNIERAEKESQELLKLREDDEIAIWYMSKICRDKKDFNEEKQYLEKLIDISPLISQIKAQQRLQTVYKLIEKQEKEDELEKLVKENYTEETRQEFLSDLEKRFINGEIMLSNLNEVIEEAKKYPNFIQSLIFILDIKVKITDNLQDKIQGLEEYADTSYTLTPEEYDKILNEKQETREQIIKEEQIQSALDKYYEDQADGR